MLLLFVHSTKNMLTIVPWRRERQRWKKVSFSFTSIAWKDCNKHGHTLHTTTTEKEGKSSVKHELYIMSQGRCPPLAKKWNTTNDDHKGSRLALRLIEPLMFTFYIAQCEQIWHVPPKSFTKYPWMSKKYWLLTKVSCTTYIFLVFSVGRKDMILFLRHNVMCPF